MKKIVWQLLILSMLSACETRSSFDEWFLVVEEQKAVVDKQMNNTPYKKEQQEDLKSYFTTISNFAASLSSDESVRKAVNKRLLKEDMGSVCKRGLVAKADWQQIVKNCTKNQFFLCAEEVRKYEANIAAIRAQLQPSLQELVVSVPDCKIVFFQ
ncbi:MAG TPA: hypothetical protein DCS07_16405 [Bdellovibrionales bacterium]|nr:MAG: hypothetical protein A2X97_12240 [Bdellovibrionales bacterium GWA1_52_35]OFZ39762.1 MAG: hypothetical protein A2070_01060 [Bdellovibrionales bacterium GWC1_52_8]HAR44187.1 hypothetical protein [Bdellovibrionales bacterium]HCM41603.1 hypothetical protein [Bdellovibrionales bacterium]